MERQYTECIRRKEATANRLSSKPAPAYRTRTALSAMHVPRPYKIDYTWSAEKATRGELSPEPLAHLWTPFALATAPV